MCFRWSDFRLLALLSVRLPVPTFSMATVVAPVPWFHAWLIEPLKVVEALLPPISYVTEPEVLYPPSSTPLPVRAPSFTVPLKSAP